MTLLMNSVTRTSLLHGDSIVRNSRGIKLLIRQMLQCLHPGLEGGSMQDHVIDHVIERGHIKREVTVAILLS